MGELQTLVIDKWNVLQNSDIWKHVQKTEPHDHPNIVKTGATIEKIQAAVAKQRKSLRDGKVVFDGFKSQYQQQRKSGALSSSQQSTLIAAIKAAKYKMTAP